MSANKKNDDAIMTMGLRLFPETHKTMMESVGQTFPNLMEEHGLDINNGSTLMRLALSNLVSNPPNQSLIQNVIFACRNDKTFKMYFERILI